MDLKSMTLQEMQEYMESALFQKSMVQENTYLSYMMGILSKVF